MQKVLAIRTPEGHYLEFATVRAELEDGSEVVIDLSKAVFAEVLGVPDAALPTATPPPFKNENGGRRTIVIDGAGGISSEEAVHGS